MEMEWGNYSNASLQTYTMFFLYNSSIIGTFYIKNALKKIYNINAVANLTSFRKYVTHKTKLAYSFQLYK